MDVLKKCKLKIWTIDSKFEFNGIVTIPKIIILFLSIFAGSRGNGRPQGMKKKYWAPIVMLNNNQAYFLIFGLYLQVLEVMGILQKCKRFSGTSGGSVVAMMLAINDNS